MFDTIPGDLISGVRDVLKSDLTSFSFSSGGCINQGGKLTTTSGDFFIKWNDAQKFPLMFEAEAKGLQLLRTGSKIDIPHVIAHGVAGNKQFLILDFIEQKPKLLKYWEHLGEQLASVHRSTGTLFGLDHENYIGSLPQINKEDPSWVDFFIHQRLVVQVSLAAASNLLSVSLQKQFDAFYYRMPSFLPVEKPSLLHGDLWSGNLITNRKGEPCLIDPAVYYGNREVDLAMTALFGGFDQKFIDSYQMTFPLIPGYRDRFEIYNLYPLLVHLNLFGSSYLNSIISILKRFS